MTRRSRLNFPCVPDDPALPTPCLLLDEARMAGNIARFNRHLARQGLAARPHLKTCKSMAAAQRVLRTPAGPATVSTLAEAEYFAANGVTDICYAVGMTPDKLERVLALRRGGTDLSVILDDPVTAGLLDAAAKRLFSDGDSPLPVLLELDCDGHRSGLDPQGEELLAVAAAVQASPFLELRGVLTHAGAAYACTDTAQIAALARQEGEAAVAAAERLRAAGHECAVRSVGSTPTALLGEYPQGVTEVRAGVYPFMDLTMCGLGVCMPDEVALSVLTTVIGHRRQDGALVVDAGWMALAQDRGLEARFPRWGYGLPCTLDGALLPGLRVSECNQEHGIISPCAGEDAPGPALHERFPAGSRLRILPNHACATAAQHDAYHVLRQGQITACWERIRGW